MTIALIVIIVLLAAVVIGLIRFLFSIKLWP